MSDEPRRSDEKMSPEELWNRLQEAEETIRAIREGEVDALVVRRDAAEQIFTLHGSDPYRVFMEAMDHGAAALGASGEVLYANAAMTRLLALDGETSHVRIIDLLPVDQRSSFERLLEGSSTGIRTTQLTLLKENEAHYYKASVAQLQVGFVDGWAVTFTDMTDRIRAEQSAASEQATRAILSSVNEAVLVCDEKGILKSMNAAALAIAPSGAIGKPFEDAIEIRLTATSAFPTVESVIDFAMAGVPVQSIEAHLPRGDRVSDVLISAAPLFVGGKNAGCVVTMVDLSQRKAAERQQDLLMAELDHRVKNNLALVLSILRRSKEDTVEGFKHAFSARIQALAATHNLLAKQSWSDIKAEDLVPLELAPYVSIPGPRVEMAALDFEISPRAATALGLVLHELATNAVKYGSLSNDCGKVVVHGGEDLDGRRKISWKEVGGPLITAPGSHGFGHTIITRSLQYAKGGGAILSFFPSGLECEIVLPIE